MIRLVDSIPEVTKKSAELIKLRATFNAYKRTDFFGSKTKDKHILI